MRTVAGETINTDNEGTVKDGDNQTNQTIGRTATGAVIRAIFGDHNGAAIGARVGAGVGSVYIQGRDDLELMTGEEYTLRSTGPNLWVFFPQQNRTLSR